MEFYMIHLAGLLWLDSAIGPLVTRLAAEEDYLPELAADALVRIGSDDVVAAIRDAFPIPEWSFPYFAANVLGRIHSDAALATCRELLEREDDQFAASRLACAWLDQLDPPAVDAVRQVIDENLDSAEWCELCENVCALAAILDIPLPPGWRDTVLRARTRARWQLLGPLADLEIGRSSFESDEPDESELADEIALGQAPVVPIVNSSSRIGRNDPCPCGSGKKYKKCCLRQ